jgi:hypothetical protein
MQGWQSEVTKVLIGLIGTAAGGLLTYLWQRRRTSDKELFLMLRGAFDRPAFKGPYLWRSDHQGFQQAIATTLKAVKTGRLFDRHGHELLHVEGRYVGSFLVRNVARRKSLQEIEGRLQKIDQLSKEIGSSSGNPNEDAMRSMDRERDEVVQALNRVWRNLGIMEMRLPTEYEKYEETMDPNS